MFESSGTCVKMNLSLKPSAVMILPMSSTLLFSTPSEDSLCMPLSRDCGDVGINMEPKMVIAAGN